jgi:phosphate transport system substrate-binding protein
VKRWHVLGLGVILASCGGERKTSDSATSASSASGGSNIDLTGAGATFPYPIYNKWFSDYAAQTGVHINYQAIGSGGGIKQLSDQTVDFGASDAPMTDEEMSKAKGGAILHIPTVIGAVTIAYNLPDVTQPLKLTGDVLGDIYLGKITKWSDSRITALNSGATLPSRDILVVHRSEGSGTTFIFTDYLSSVSPAWKAGPGTGKDVKWPTGLGGKGNDGVAGAVKQTVGALGYVELAYAKQNKLPVADLKNAAGRFVTPSVESATAAAAGVAAKLPPNTDYRVSIINAPGADAYPISSFTWLLVYRNMSDQTKAKKLHDFLKWALASGEQSASQLYYAPLPDQVKAQLSKRVDSLAAVGSGAK